MNFHPSNDFLDCLGWTLLHFLWQGLVIAALLGGTLWLLRRRSANLRYLVGCFALLLLAVAPVITFQSLQRPDREPLSLRFTQTISAEIIAEKNLPPFAAPQTHSVATLRPPVHQFNFSETLETALPWFVAAWSLGVLILSCRLFAGWLVIQKLRRSATTELIEPWQPKLKELARRVGVSRPVRLLQSACVEVPAVIGWLRPVILLPASCLAGLTPAQLESILAHELAHIRRHDYLVNLLQNLVETLLFYHPAVWWVSRRIRAEREHCCDDLAVKICGDAATYARALATLEELRPAPAQLALAAGGAPLLERIRRLAGQTERPPARPAWPVAGVIAILLLALIVAGLRNNPAQAASSAVQPGDTNQSTIPPASAKPIAPTEPINPPAPVVEIDKTVVVAAPTPSPVPPSPQEAQSTNQPAKQSPPADSARPVKDEPPQVNIKSRWVEMDAAKAGSGPSVFTKALGEAQWQSLQQLPATFTFSDYLVVKSTNSAEPDQFIFLHGQTNEGPLSLVLSERQNRSVVDALERHDGVDILTTPEITTESDRQCQVQAVDITNMLAGGPGGFTNQPLPTGPVIDIVPHVSADRRSIKLTITGTVTEFVGYEDPATVTNRSGKRMPKGWAIPHLRLRQFTATVSVPDAQTLVLGGPPVPMTQQKKTKRTFFGRLFHSAKSDVDTVDKTLLLLITPTLIKPDGTRYHVSHTSPARQALLSKLDNIRLDTVAYDHVPLVEVIRDLDRRSRDFDPEKAGILFFISREALSGTAGGPGIIDPISGLPWPPDALEKFKHTTISIKPALHDVRLADVLDAIVKNSDSPIRYSISEGYLNMGHDTNRTRDGAVVFSPRNTNGPHLEIRAFHINPKTFRSALEEISFFPPAAVTNTSRKPFIADQSYSLDELQVAVREFFAVVGVDLNTNNPVNVGKAFVWNDRKGVLTVRATASDLDLIAVAIETLNIAPPPINIKTGPIGTPITNGPPLKTRTFHVNQAAFAKALGFNLTNMPAGFKSFVIHSDQPDLFSISLRRLFVKAGADFDADNPANADKTFFWTDREGVLMVRATAKDLDSIGIALEALNPSRPQINLKVKFAEITQLDSPALGFNWNSNSGPPAQGVFLLTSNGATLASSGTHVPVKSPTISSVSAILTPAQYQVVLKALQTREGAETVDAHEVTTESGRQIQVQGRELQTNHVPGLTGIKNGVNSPIVDQMFSRTLPSAPVLDLIPYVSADESAVQMTAIATVTEFVGLDDPKPLKTDMEGKPLVGAGPPLPHFRLRQSTSEATILDGNTYVFNVMLPAVPVPSANVSGKNGSASTPKKNLMIFITPTIINPDGTRYHTEQHSLLDIPGVSSAILPVPSPK